MTTEQKCIYLRVSTDKQEYDMQYDALRRNFGAELDGIKIFCDKESGMRSSRPGYVRMCDAIAQRRIQCVYAYDWDRLTRSMRDMLTLVKHCRKYGCEIKTCQFQLDLKSDMADIVIAMLGWLSQNEWVRINRRRNGSLRTKTVKEGWRAGGSEKGWISKKVLERSKDVYALLDAGFSQSRICARLHMNPKQVRKLIAIRGKKGEKGDFGMKRRPGKVAYRGKVKPDAYLVNYDVLPDGD